MKWLVRIIGIVIVVLILLAVGVYFYADSLVKQAVERGGTYATGVETTVDSVQLGLFTGEAGLEGLEIANPPGFERDYFLKLGEADLAVGLGSLMSDVARVPRLHLTGIDLNLERTGDKPNYQVILDNLERLSSGEKAPPPEGEAQQWIIDDLQVRDVHVIATVEGLAAETQTVEVTIPQIVLKDVKSDSLAELQGQVLKQILSAVIQQAGTQLPGIMLTELTAGVGRIGDLGEATLTKVAEATAIVGDVTERVGEIGGKAGEAVQEAQEKVGEVRKQADEALEDVTQGLGGLLGGGDKDKPKTDEPAQ